MELFATGIGGICFAETSSFVDSRGEFTRLFCAKELGEAHGSRPIVQINRTLTRSVGAVRGLHYQKPPNAEAKWVRVLRGRIWDVAVDLRAGSPTFLQWYATELSAENKIALFIPEGCAHGFQCLEPDSELLYLHTAYYDPSKEGGLRWDEPKTAISWPLAVTEMSDRDKNHAFLDAQFEGLVC